MAKTAKKKVYKSEWQLQDAKAQFSELVRHAQSEGPQWVTKQGEPTVVVLAIEDYEKLRAPKNKHTLSEFLRASPLTGLGLSFEPRNGTMRNVSF